MADPFSIIGAVAVAIHDIHRAKTFIEGIARAPRVVARLRDGLVNIIELLDDFSEFVNQPQKGGDSVPETVLPHLRSALANCKNVATEIDAVLRPYIKITGQVDRTAWRRFKWPFNGQKVAGLQKDMSACMQTLQAAFAFTNLVIRSTDSKRVVKVERGVKRIQLHMGIDNMSVADSQYAGSIDTAYYRNDRIKNWIMGSHTVVKEYELEDNRENLRSPHELGKKDTTSESSNDIRVRKAGVHLQHAMDSPVEYLGSVFDGTDPPPADYDASALNVAGRGQWLRKAVASRAALQHRGLAFDESVNDFYLYKRLSADELDELRLLSERLDPRRNDRWTSLPNNTAQTTSEASPLHPAHERLSTCEDASLKVAKPQLLTSEVVENAISGYEPTPKPTDSSSTFATPPSMEFPSTIRQVLRNTAVATSYSITLEPNGQPTQRSDLRASAPSWHPTPQNGLCYVATAALSPAILEPCIRSTERSDLRPSAPSWQPTPQDGLYDAATAPLPTITLEQFTRPIQRSDLRPSAPSWFPTLQNGTPDTATVTLFPATLELQTPLTRTSDLRPSAPSWSPT